MKIHSRRALTLIELLVALLISSILILMVGTLSQLAIGSHEELKKESDVYSDLFYGLSRLTFMARKASQLSRATWPDPWVTDVLIVDNSAFGLYHYTRGGISYCDFVFVPDKTDPSVRQPLLAEADGTTSFTVTPNGRSVSVQIQGSKLTQGNKVKPFAISHFVVTRRN
ncbi:MAG TPA: type II secretion system protein [Patescibacteria group bacterium]|nr:type II secretion system protein [Patescibacteria group bacterium]